MTDGRIEKCFTRLADERRAGLVTFITAGDPDLSTSREILAGLPDAGADIIELGMPFSDPMADGPVIQAASLRALKSDTTLKKVLDLVRGFRTDNNNTPVILMGYFNPIYAYGVEAFVKDAVASGVDGLIVVDVPPESDRELCLPALEAGLRFIRLVAPTTNENRLSKILKNTSGFLYYVAITGVTGTKSAAETNINEAVTRIRRYTNLPIAVGFGIKSSDDAKAAAQYADAVVVGSAIVAELEASLDSKGKATLGTKQKVLDFVGRLALGVSGEKR